MGQPHNLTQIVINGLPVLVLVPAWVLLFTFSRAETGKAARGMAVLVVWVLVLASYGFTALSVPWTWTGSQILVAVLSIVLAFIFLVLGRTWWLSGYPAVTERLARVGEVSSGGPKPTLGHWLLWIVVAAILIFSFNLLRHRPA